MKRRTKKYIGLCGFDDKLFEEDEGGGTRGIIRVYLFEASNSVVAK